MNSEVKVELFLKEEYWNEESGFSSVMFGSACRGAAGKLCGRGILHLLKYIYERLMEAISTKQVLGFRTSSYPIMVPVFVYEE
jgi:hypothetical protein